MEKYKTYIKYFVTGIPFSLLAAFFGIINTIYFMSGILIGWETYRTYIKLKNSIGSVYSLKFMHLVNALLSVILASCGFLVGVGLLHLFNII